MSSRRSEHGTNFFCQEHEPCPSDSPDVKCCGTPPGPESASGRPPIPGFWAPPRSPNEKLNIAGIGVGGQGGWDIGNCASENIVAVCDVDDRRAAGSFTRFPKAKRYRDFRKMLEEMDRQIDAVVVGTPDHTHAPPAVMAMKMGKHCYCEKPLAHSVHEVRTMIELANKNKLATQMGTQIHAEANYRRVVELVQSGAIGPVGEVHVWHPVSYGGNGRPKDTPPVPKELDWDLWLGPAPYRPYHPCYLPGTWRSWWDFGSGGLGDFGCHYMDLPYWALKLRHPTTIEAEGPPVQVENTSPGLIVRYEFPARDKLPPVKMTWYDGGKRPPLLAERKIPAWGAAVLFVGQKRDADRRLWSAQVVAGIAVRRFQAAAADDPRFHRPSRRVDPGLQDRRPDHLQLRLLRHACGNGPAGQRGLPRRQEAPVGPGGPEGHQLPRSGPVPPDPISPELELKPSVVPVNGMNQVLRGSVLAWSAR